MSLTVAASLWSTPKDRLDSEALRLAAAGLRRWHWDVSDGVLAAPGGFDVDTVERLTRLTGLPGEAHLMVTDPLSQVDAWAPSCDRIVVHVESTGWADSLDRIRSLGRQPGVAISPGTPLGALTGVPSDVAILVMSIVPGQAGSTFIPTTVERLRALADGRDLGVDGGVTLDHARACASNGATWVVSGSALCSCAEPSAWLAAASGTAQTSPGAG